MRGTSALAMAQKAVNVAVRTGRPKISWLDLQGSGLSVVERLCLEEALLRHDPLRRCWAVVGNHDPTHHTRLTLHGATQGDQYVMPVVHNANCVIVMGIGGKPEKLLDVDLVKEDGVQVVKRFSGGGTIVVDHSSLWTTFIVRTKDLPDVEPYPRDIMKWSADAVFAPAFTSMKADMIEQGVNKKTLVLDNKSCGTENTGRSISVQSGYDMEIPDFELVETDYVFGKLKIGGNAQAITKEGWLHHSSFLWDYVDEHMSYLAQPEKQPEYRANRSHEDFLVKLKKYYGHLEGGKKTFFSKVKQSSAEVFELEEVTLKEALQMIDTELGGFQEWFDGKCRTTVVELPDSSI